jgi:hypothetical protein
MKTNSPAGSAGLFANEDFNRRLPERQRSER